MHTNNAIKVTPDKEKAKSLTETAGERIQQSAKEINEKNANFIFEDYYSSIIELVHAKVIRDGWNISNHVCLGLYIKDILKRDDLFAIFDDLRYKRNSLTYYGKRMDFEVAKDAIAKARKLMNELKTIVEGVQS